MPSVSGKKIEVIIAKYVGFSYWRRVTDSPMRDSMPNTVFENHAYSWSRPKMSGDKAPPTRAQLEQKPTADERTQVG